MSYSVNLYGHKDFESAAETEAFEREVIQRVTDFAHSLPGLSGGTINTGSQPQEVLQASDGAAPTGPTGAPLIAPDGADEPENPTPAVVEPLPAASAVGSPAELATLSTAELQAEIARRSAG